MDYKEKAKEIVDSFKLIIVLSDKWSYLDELEEIKYAKQCAILHVEGLRNQAIMLGALAYTNENGEVPEIREEIESWNKVLQELKSM